MRVRDQDILLPTTMVGSYPKPEWLHGKIFGEYDEPDYINYRIKERYEDAVRLCVDDQKRAGIDMICDGQQYYESETMHEYGQVFHFWGHHLKGFKRWGDPIAIPLYKKFHAPAVVDDIEWVRPIYAPTAELTRFARGDDAPIKIAMQGPLFLAFCCTDQHYGDIKPLAMAIAKAFNKEFKDLAARGVDQIQVHEPLTYYGEEPWFIDVLNAAFEGVDAHRIWHICYGNQGGNPGVAEPRGQDMFPFAFDADVDQIHIETMRRGAGDSAPEGAAGADEPRRRRDRREVAGDRDSGGGRRPADGGGTVRAGRADRGEHRLRPAQPQARARLAEVAGAGRRHPDRP